MVEADSAGYCTDPGCEATGAGIAHGELIKVEKGAYKALRDEIRSLNRVICVAADMGGADAGNCRESKLPEAAERLRITLLRKSEERSQTGL